MSQNNNSRDTVSVDRWYFDAVQSLAADLPPQYPELPTSLLIKQLLFKFKKKSFKNEEKRQQYYNDMPLRDVRCLALLEHMREMKNCGKGAVAVLAPHPQNPTLSASDGYMRRVAAIDSALFDGLFRVYIYDSPYWKVDEPRCRFYGAGSVEIIYNSRYASHRLLVRNLVEQSSVCYIQSVLRLLSSVFPERGEYLVDPFGFEGVKYVLDMHGTVPVELRLEGKEAEAEVAEKAERLCVENADVIVTVNDVTREYLMQKYGEKLPKLITCPIFSCGVSQVPSKEEGLRVIYAGGSQAWQLLEEMKTAISQCPRNDVEYDILINGIGEEEKEQLQGLCGGYVGSVPASEVAGHYAKAHYGFMLRDDNDINRYSAPTKLFEYMSFGIVPIIKCPHLGDFAALGMQYLPVEEFMQGNIPDESRRLQMVETNKKVLDCVLSARDSGIEKLVSELHLK